MTCSDVKKTGQNWVVLRFSVGPLCDKGRYFAEWLSLNTDSVPCWTQVPDKHAAGNLMFTFHSGSSFRQSRSQEVNIRFFSKSILWQSGSQKLDVLKWQQLRSSQSGWFLRQSWCHEPGSPLSFHVAVSDKHAVRISTWVLQNPQFQVSATCSVWLPWVVNLQGDRHLCRPIQAASIGVNLQLWYHRDTKAKEKVAVLSSPHQRSLFVTRSTTAICGEFWETFATGRATSRQWKSLLAKWRLPIGTLCCWANLLSRSS